jgi:hypothetical protein
MFNRLPVVNLAIAIGIDATAAADSAVIPFGDQNSGMITIPAKGVSVITWFASTDSVKFGPAYDGSYPTPLLLTQTVSPGQRVTFPYPLLSAAAIKVVATGAGDVGGTANVCLKN